MSATISDVRIDSAASVDPNDTITVSVTLRDVPASDTGTVSFYVSQNPLPLSSWTYVGSTSIQNAESSVVTYQWNVGGDIGVYYIRAVLTDVTQSVTHDSFMDAGITLIYRVIVNVAPAGSVQQPPAELRLCDANNRQSIVLTQYDSFSYIERWGAKDTFTLTMSRKAEHSGELLAGRIILVPADQTHDYYRVLVILQIKVDDEMITASGSDYLWDLLDTRIANYNITSVEGYSITDHQTGVAETVARHYINVNCLEASATQRRDAFTVLEDERVSPETPLGGNVDIEARLQTLAEIMESICTQGGINLYGALVEDDTLPRGWYIEARFSVGTDHSQDDNNPNSWVVLSEEYGNARMTSYNYTLPTATIAEVYGQVTIHVPGIGSGYSYVKRLHTEVGDTSLVGTDRREVFVDASDCSSTASMTARGNETLDDAKMMSVEMSLVNTDMYNRDFTLGDTVTCDLGSYGAYNLPISEVKTVYSDDGTTMSVVLGAKQDGVMTVIRDAIQATPLRRQ